MGKACLANYIGGDACWLLTFVAHTEDARHYRGPVTFFNEQLLPILGGKSVDTLDRVRRRCIAAGWLHYEPGRKGRPGTYWVLIPDEHADQDDAPTDEGRVDCQPDTSAPVRNKAVDSSASVRNKEPDTSAPARVEVRKEAGEKCGTKPERSAEHSSLALPLTLTQEKNEESPEPAPPDSGPPPNPPPEPPVMEFPVNGTGPRLWPLSASKANEYRESFPGIDVEAELRKARQWALDNPTKRKTARGMAAFLGRWLGTDRQPEDHPRRPQAGGGGAHPVHRRGPDRGRVEGQGRRRSACAGSRPSTRTTTGVECCVMGERGLARRGWLVKVGQKLYSSAGRARKRPAASSPGDDSPLPKRRALAKIQVPKDLEQQLVGPVHHDRLPPVRGGDEAGDHLPRRLPVLGPGGRTPTGTRWTQTLAKVPATWRRSSSC
jgi:hypothetical protein